MPETPPASAVVAPSTPHHDWPVSPARANGIRIDPIQVPSLGEVITGFLACGRSHVAHFVSADPTVLGRRNPAFADTLNAGDLNLPDGISIIATLRLGGRRCRRVTGSDALSFLGRWGIDRGTRHYLLGAEPGVAETLRRRLGSQLPTIKIVGTDTLPTGPTADQDLREIARRVKAAGTELLWIGLGTPSQQLVAARLRELDSAPVILCVGAAFDFASGLKRRPPVWMQRTGLEWLGRLIAEPRRLWRRYLIGNAVFVVGATEELLRERRRNRR